MPLAQCIKRGELHAFDLALEEGEDEFVKRRIYLTLERGRDIAQADGNSEFDDGNTRTSDRVSVLIFWPT